MFLEVHTTIIDMQKRYIDLSVECEDFPGTKMFGEWEDKGDYIQCSAVWMSCFGGYFSNLMLDLGMLYKNGDIKHFNRCAKDISDPVSAFLYALMLSQQKSNTSLSINK